MNQKIKKPSIPDLEFSKQVKKANQRLREIEKRGLTKESSAYKNALGLKQYSDINNMGYFGTTKKDQFKFATDIKRIQKDPEAYKAYKELVRSFLRSHTSTVSGMKKVQKAKKKYKALFDKQFQEVLSKHKMNKIKTFAQSPVFQQMQPATIPQQRLKGKYKKAYRTLNRRFRSSLGGNLSESEYNKIFTDSLFGMLNEYFDSGDGLLIMKDIMRGKIDRETVAAYLANLKATTAGLNAEGDLYDLYHYQPVTPEEDFMQYDDFMV